jgi:pimeloyl-ACP methyl ester carboxylesterase
MGNAVSNRVLFPAPTLSYDSSLQGIFWDTQFPSNIARPFLYIPFQSKSGVNVPTILYLHANACDIGGISWELQQMSNICECNILAVEYPGYGLYNEENSTPSGINQAAEHGIAILLSRGVHPGNIVLFGRSIGTGPATRLAELLKSRGWAPFGLILQSPYVSIHRVVSDYSRFGTWLIGNHWDNKRNIAQLGADVPILIIHGEKDDIISVDHAKELYTLCNSRRKHLVCPPFATHNEWDLFNDVLKPVRDFVRRYQAGSKVIISEYQCLRPLPGSPIMRGL